MKLGIRGKLFAGFFGLIMLSLLAGEIYLRPAIEANLLERIRADLFARLSLIDRDAAKLPDRDRARWDALADELGPRAHGRVTFIDEKGLVLGDSEVALAELEHVENHRERPEVAAAFEGAPQTAMRFSATIQKRLMYAAIPMALPGGARGVARLAVPIDEVAASVGAVRHIMWGALLVALIVALVASTTVAQVLSRALARMTDVARRMAGGDLAARLRPSGRDEIAELGRALDLMATNLAATMTALRGERDLLGLILESMREGVLVLDHDGRMLLVNPALRGTLGIPADIEGRAALELIRNAELSSILSRAQAAIGIGGLLDWSRIRLAGILPALTAHHNGSIFVRFGHHSAGDPGQGNMKRGQGPSLLQYP